MDKFFLNKIISSKKGQSAVEYILLLGVISALGVTIINNKRFKDFIAGQDGLFAIMKKGMAYSYCYGRENDSTDVDQKLNFDYKSKNHDTYYNSTGGHTHFFTNKAKYP